jgi:hypothetical protein
MNLEDNHSSFSALKDAVDMKPSDFTNCLVSF